MKNLGYIVLGCIIGALITYCFKPEDIQSNSMSSKEKKGVKKPRGLITIAEGESLSKRWTEYRQGAVDSAYYRQRKGKRNKEKNNNDQVEIFGPERKDTRNVWWSIEDIEDYIAYAKWQTDSLGYSITGLRFYLGVYGDNAGVSKKDRTTIFMVPTGTKNVSRGSSFNTIARRGNEDDVPGADPNNEGNGGDGPYPGP